jgi:hypothetical protein
MPCPRIDPADTVPPCMARKTGRAGAALLLVLATAGCALPAPPGAETPSTATATSARVAAAPAGGGWAQALVFSGDVRGTMDGVVADGDATRSECSGRNSRPDGAWASALFGPVGEEVYEVVVTVRPYRGPGTYRTPDVAVQVSMPDGSEVWQTSGADPATFTVGVSEESGTVDATLTNLASTTTRLRLTGRWSCRT